MAIFTNIKKKENLTIDAGKFNLKLLNKKNITKKYLSWLNDKKTSKFSSRKNLTFNLKDIEKYIEYHNKSKNSLLLGIFIKNNHIGNLKATKIISNKLPNFFKIKNNVIEIATLISRNFWNQRVAKYSTIFFVNFIFKNTDCKLIYFSCYDNHYASIFKSLSLGSKIIGIQKRKEKNKKTEVIFMALTKKRFYEINKKILNYEK